MLFDNLKKKATSYGWIMPTIIAVIAIAIGIVMMVFSQAIGAKMVGTVQQSNTINTTEWNITRDNLDTQQSTAKWNPTIVLVLIAGLLISLIMSVLLGVFVGKR